MSKIIIAIILYEKVPIYLLELSIIQLTHRRVDHVYLNKLCLRISTNLYTIDSGSKRLHVLSMQ